MQVGTSRFGTPRPCVRPSGCRDASGAFKRSTLCALVALSTSVVSFYYIAWRCCAHTWDLSFPSAICVLHEAASHSFSPTTRLYSAQRLVRVDGKVRTDSTYPAGFMDVVQIPKTDEHFRLLFDTKVNAFALQSRRRILLCICIYCFATAQEDDAGRPGAHWCPLLTADASPGRVAPPCHPSGGGCDVCRFERQAPALLVDVASGRSLQPPVLLRRRPGQGSALTPRGPCEAGNGPAQPGTVGSRKTAPPRASRGPSSPPLTMCIPPLAGPLRDPPHHRRGGRLQALQGQARRVRQEGYPLLRHPRRPHHPLPRPRDQGESLQPLPTPLAARRPRRGRTASSHQIENADSGATCGRQRCPGA